MVMPLTDCIARPKEANKTFLLTDHLFTVGQGMGSPDGEWSERLDFLAGLMHDAGKARLPWQKNIRSDNPKRGSVIHSVYGAILFAYCADHLYSRLSLTTGERLAFQWRVMRWVRDIMDHHGKLDDIVETSLPWAGACHTEELEDMDLPGLHRFLTSCFPELSDLELSVQNIKKWQRQFKKKWRSWHKEHVREHVNREQATELCMRTSTARMIQADRFDAAFLEKRTVTNEEVREALDHLTEHIGRSMSEMSAVTTKSTLSQLRQHYQQKAVNRYIEQRMKRIFTLRLPTGMGKTLTALKIALTACLEEGKQRIVYVAPYLSILSQATAELRKATGLEVQQHHSLTWSEDKEWDDKAVLLLESWQAPIVTTTFHQLFRGLFPSKAQETLRLAGLKNSVLILDEPQIVSEAAWIPFLKMLEQTTEALNMQIVFVSATIPPLSALDAQPVSLVTEEIPYPLRYSVRLLHKPLSEKDLALKLIERLRLDRHVGAILNTIEDSVRVVEEVNSALKDLKDDLNVEIIHLNGAMTPLHKSLLIQKVKKHLSGETDRDRLLVVSTQLIEAGVNISFNAVFRALPIYPSLVQAAGRINRHAEGETGELIVFPFYREGEKNTRNSVYKEQLFRDETDNALAKQDSWLENDFISEVEGYYDNVYARMRADASFTKIVEAAKGYWRELANLSPFEEDNFRISVFVPWGEDFLSQDADHLSEEEAAIQNGLLRLMRRFELESIVDIFDRYENVEWMSRLTFVERKQFMGLMQQFIVPMSVKTAKGIVAELRDEQHIKRITSLDQYSDTSGLAQHIGSEAGSIMI